MPDLRRPDGFEEFGQLDPAGHVTVDDPMLDAALQRLNVRVQRDENAREGKPDFEVSTRRSGPAPGRRVRRRVTVAVAAGIALVAAAVVTVDLVLTAPSDRRDSSANQSAAVTQAAHALLDSWTAAHPAGSNPVVVTGELATPEGEWTGPEKVAFVSGLVNVSPTAVVTGTPATTVRWSDGTSAPAAPLSPAKALAQLYHSPNSEPGIAPLIVTAAAASTVAVDTTRGSATLPAWRMALQGTSTTITVIAAAATTRETVGIAEPGREVGDSTVSVDNVSIAPNGRTVTAHFTGSPGPASEPCGEDYSAEVVENAAAVVIIVYRHPYSATGAPTSNRTVDEGCRLVGAPREATAQLDRAWDDRPVLDLYTGQPVTAN